jgi:hypothetical protein
MLQQFLQPQQMESGLTHQTRKIKDWVREIMNLPNDTIVMVTELQSVESGCPPLETVIDLLDSNQEKRQAIIHKLVLTVSYQDVKEACKKLETCPTY